jgi:4-diphosphocytidyl-2-C-methyl-D-erythritol kinase
VPLPQLPPLWLVLVNPRVPVATAQVFAALTCRENAPVPELPDTALASAADLAGWLSTHTRNDLSEPALRIAPVLARVQGALSGVSGCLLARMSGSGGTHFGLFATEAAAEAAALSLARAHADWWVMSASVLTG